VLLTKLLFQLQVYIVLVVSYTSRTSYLTPWSTALLEELDALQLVKKFLAVMEPAVSLACSHQSAIRLSSESDQSRPGPPSPFIEYLIVFPPIPKYSKWYLSFWFPHHNPAHISRLQHTYNITCPYQPPGFDHQNNIWQGVHIMKLFIMQYTSASCYSSFLGTHISS
jgi:hypothetical protein